MKILLACGGTGGHIFPGIALAEALEKKISGVEVVFVGSPRGLENKILAKTKWRLAMIAAPTFADKKGVQKLQSLMAFPKALWTARGLLKEERPALVVGVGGYTAAPVLMMASLGRIPTFAIEPNIVPGLTNRLLKFFVQKVFVAFPGMEKYFGKKARLTGVPVREGLLSLPKKSTPGARHQVLILGGSQGARFLNETLRQALPYLKDVKDRLHFIHPVGPKFDLGLYKQAYAENGISAEVYPFIEEIGAFYARADFVIGRAGAGTVAELMALKIPSLLIPYPYAQGGHQEAQARYLETIGGAEVLLETGLTPQQLANKIQEFLQTPEKLTRMATSLEKVGGANAAEKVVEICSAQL